MGVMSVRTYLPAISLLVLICAVAVDVHGQSFRGEINTRETLSSGGEIDSSISSGDVILLSVDESALRFVTGLDIVIEPESDSIVPGSFTVAVFGAVDPPEESGVQNFAGRRLSTIPLTNPVRQRVFVPFRSDYAGTENSITDPADPRIGDIAIQLVPIMKGMDSRALSAAYSVNVTPRLRPVGAVRISVVGDPELVQRTREELEISLDGETIEADTVIEREPGIYRLEARAGDFLDVTSNVGIAQGRIREISLEPQEPVATVRVSVPTVAEVYWNGNRMVDHSSFTASPGEHSVMVRIGDFTVSKRIELNAHEDYELAIDLDILINRN
jgi:hypothetical protein